MKESSLQPASPPSLPKSDDHTSEADYHCDVLVIGGGINGVGIARDLAGRGWRVVMCEQEDLASHTSSSSTKLIHGGLRYLEYGEFGLVRKALMERELLLRSAPHIMWPLRFVLPHDASMRPAWMIRLGLWLYDNLAPREFLPGCESVALNKSPLGEPLKPGWTKGFVYSDGWVDDARLVALCALDAAEQGAQILTRTRCEATSPHAGGWRATLAHLDPNTQAATHKLTVQARMVVNAAGPWAEHMLRQVMAVPTTTGKGGDANKKLRLVKGSHIVVPRIFNHDHAYIFQGQDKRIIFAIPYERDFTLIGTTDVEHKAAPGHVQIEPEEVVYLCTELSRYLRRPVQPGDVVWSYAGVRPLLDDESGKAAAVTRDYRLQTQLKPSPWLTVWGGKLTTFRLLSQEAADEVGKMLGDERHQWTADAVLPGGFLGDLIEETGNPMADMAEFQTRLRRRHPWMDLGLMRRWTRAYGSRVLRLLDGVRSRGDLGAEIAPDLYEAELFYLKRHEWAMTADDVLWRRSKLGLHYSAAQRQAVADWFVAQGSRAGEHGFHHSALSR
ncbi:glycerol-3-phosphate dehydrogenase [Aquabacterium sp.]|uniref:glycerol-3-phosphate dehydrogenase n=1 Tax=Aquabacterium sp. TaxID=1872578 RepID=UPI0039C8591C